MDARPVILFDGLCNLCTGAVRFVIERDGKGVFDFASLQSDAARRLLAGAGAAAGPPESIVLIDDQGVHLRSDAALRIAPRLRAPWPLLAALRVVPRALRDAVYDFVAGRRYGWFGRREACLVPTPALRARFLDAGQPRVPGPAAPRPSPADRK
jgi:predicted DCC family thiol-disulfide oxidoreductase YuxK